MKIAGFGDVKRRLGQVPEILRSAAPKSRRGRAVLVFAAALVVLGGISPVIVQKVTEIPDGVALRVGETDVTTDEVQRRIDVLRSLYGITQPADPAERDRFLRETAKSVGVGVVLDNAVRSRNITVTEESARQTLQQMIEVQLASEEGGSFPDLLREYGASERDVLDEIKRQQNIDQLFQQVTAEAAAGVTDDAVRGYYDEHRQTMVEPEKRAVQNIVVRSQDQAEQIAGEARSGADFGGLVQQYSLDEATKQQSGDLGLVKRDQLDGQYADAAFRDGAESIFGPVQTKHGWNIGRVAKVEPAFPMTFEQSKDRLRDELRARAATDLWRQWLEGEIRTVEVKYADEYRPDDPESVPGPQTGPGLIERNERAANAPQPEAPR